MSGNENARPSREEVKARLKAFLQQGESDDVAALLVHSLNQRAEKIAEQRAEKEAAEKGEEKAKSPDATTSDSPAPDEDSRQ